MSTDVTGPEGVIDESRMKALSLNDLLDETLDQLRRPKRLLYKTILRVRPQIRELTLLRMEQAMLDDPEIQEMGLQMPLGSDAFSAYTKYAIDLDQLERLLKILIEYLPQIIEIFMQLFSQPARRLFAIWLAMAVLTCALAGSAAAQVTCVNGKCYRQSAPVATVARAVVRAPVAVAARVVAPVVAIPRAIVTRTRAVTDGCTTCATSSTVVRVGPIRRIIAGISIRRQARLARRGR